MNQNHLLNHKRNNDEIYSRDDEWKGNIFEENSLKYKNSRND